MKSICTNIKLVMLVMLALLMGSSISVASDTEVSSLEAITTGLQKKYESITELSATFTQDAFSAMLKSSEKSKGTVSFKKPGMMRWDYNLGEKIISDGNNVWVYQPDLAQVIETTVDKSGANLATDFLSGIGNLATDFSIKLLSSDDTGYALELTPKRALGNIKKLTVRIDKNFLLKKTIALDPFHNKTTVVFNDIKTNEGIKDSHFIYKAPKGVTIVRP